MYALNFSGWAQCRLPTDPDPSNEPRGVSGYSFAFAGEPDLDRIIQFQQNEHTVMRDYTEPIGVTINSGWYLDESEPDLASVALEPGDPLLGAKVDLLGQPQFDSRNYVVVNQGYGVIWPFRLSIATTSGRQIVRQVVMDPNHPDGDPIDLPERELNEYLLSPSFGGSAMALAETGIVDPIAFRLHRLKQVRGLRADVGPPPHTPEQRVQIAALDKRISELEWTCDVNRRTQQIPTKVFCRYQINGPDVFLGEDACVSDIEPWNLEMWFGGWDVDALNFFVKGAIIVGGIDEYLAG